MFLVLTCKVNKLFNFLPLRRVIHSVTMSRRRNSRWAIEPITVKSVELFKEENGKKHFTSEYETKELVFRRGFPFRLLITLSRELKDSEKLNFDLRMGGRPMVNQGSLIRLPRIDPKPDEDVVGYNELAAVGDTVTIEVHTSAITTGVGQWLLSMQPTRGRRRLPRVSVTRDLIAIFNPWSKYDPVYMKNDSWKNEYVLNENGLQFYGSARRIGQMFWYFGQFEAVVMKACLHLLSLGRLRYRDHDDPVMVARHMSALVNSNDDNGALVGRWDGKYQDGKSPTTWVGSVAILQEFAEKWQPVKYGQCWVFSGVLTTVMRCFGIPARSVTNFESAHDTDFNLTVDYHLNKDGSSEENDDSIWNFHVWNDVWMARPNLPEGFGGWQALDATPQELSGATFRCGPMPVHAIKEGQINLEYDGLFIYAEVNGTKRYWMKDEKGEYKEVSSETDQIGQNISTKAVGANRRQDITSEYKYKEGSREEELSFKLARKYARFTKVEKKEAKKVVRFTPNVPDSVDFGKDISFAAKIENLTKSPQEIFLNVVAKAVQYNGSMVSQIMDVNFKKTVAASKSESFNISLPVSKYLSSIKDNNNVKFMFLGGDVANVQPFASQAIVDFDKPDINIEVPSSAELNKTVKVKVSFTNPLSVALDNGVFRVEGAGVKDAVVHNVKKVKPLAVCSAEIEFEPRKVGKRKIIVGFSSKQMQGLQASAEISVS